MAEIYSDVFEAFSGFDRFDFPKGIVRVTAGHGGEALLLTGSEKTALLDCGMAYCADKLIENIKKELGGKKLDYVLLSHSHYDHIGALPFIKQAWPDVITIGAEHADKVFNKQGAINTINALSKSVCKLYEFTGELNIPEGGFAIDKIVRDGDKISLGDEEITALETKGHTDCSLSFVLEPQGVMFLSESTGVLEAPDKMHITILKNYKDAMSSIEKCRNYGAKYLVSPHYGIMPECHNDKYWELLLNTTKNNREFLFKLFRQGISDEEILEKYTANYWDERRQKEQPKEAFMLNAQNIIKVFRREFESC